MAGGRKQELIVNSERLIARTKKILLLLHLLSAIRHMLFSSDGGQNRDILLLGKRLTVVALFFRRDKDLRTLGDVSWMAPTSITRSSKTAGAGGIENMRLWMLCLKSWRRTHERQRKGRGPIRCPCRCGAENKKAQCEPVNDEKKQDLINRRERASDGVVRRHSKERV
ncbi:MAG: hypothetical protein EWM73_01207 [Nitrospira sp.]|nr:MAG: hypothetical protein EWM73_01207 [Nitrospira sp.]